MVLHNTTNLISSVFFFVNNFFSVAECYFSVFKSPFSSFVLEFKWTGQKKIKLDFLLKKNKTNLSVWNMTHVLKLNNQLSPTATDNVRWSNINRVMLYIGQGLKCSDFKHLRFYNTEHRKILVSILSHVVVTPFYQFMMPYGLFSKNAMFMLKIMVVGI